MRLNEGNLSTPRFLRSCAYSDSRGLTKEKRSEGVYASAHPQRHFSSVLVSGYRPTKSKNSER